ncbi:MAG TPA: A/G-specific adenine glycosylase [Candidatus Deferrimicrobiaceae bacterium]
MIPEIDDIPFGRAASALLAWFAGNARPMPWRETSDPYRIWLSEIMLQQTQVGTVAPYYRRFLEAFPDVESLAAAPADALMKQWEGLGYYSRARNLHRCAAIVVRERGGKFPSDPAELEALPGIGRSTAGAIASIAFGRDAAILDGNVKRVVARLAAIGGDPSRSDAKARMWTVSERLVLPGTGRNTALAMMDLGAVVCTPKRPDCGGCPLNRWCRAFAEGRPEAYPGKAARKARPLREAVAAVIGDSAGRVLIRRRPDDGLLGGLWEFPGVFLGSGETQEAALARWGLESGICGLTPARRFATIRHAFTHFGLRLHGWHCRAGVPVPRSAGSWVARRDLSNHAFPKAHQMLIEKMREDGP